jgi:hypothetical protein
MYACLQWLYRLPIGYKIKSLYEHIWGQCLGHAKSKWQGTVPVLCNNISSLLNFPITVLCCRNTENFLISEVRCEYSLISAFCGSYFRISAVCCVYLISAVCIGFVLITTVCSRYVLHNSISAVVDTSQYQQSIAGISSFQQYLLGPS